MAKKMKAILSIVMGAILIFTLMGCNGEKEAANFPEKPIQVIVPFSAGGGTDVVTRAVMDSAKEFFPEPFVVVNKTGAGGAVGMGEGANAKPDGYTLTTICVELTTLPPQNLADFTSDDFRPILQINAEPAAITVRADAPWNTVEEFLNEAKQKEGQIKVGNSGVGAIWHLAAAAIEKEADVKFNHIPYDGAAPAIAALVGGHIDAITVSPAEVAAQVKAGQLKILGVADSERSKIFPDVPTLQEQGYDVVIGTWRGFAVPKGTPDEVVDILKDGLNKAVQKEEFIEFMENSGLTIAILDEEEFTEKINAENELFAELVESIKE
ncbi:tripartite tricarboxylate transporter substrate binding protein [Defluviitalea phaphyphila]|uniref:tripartite tricarboxylate transporter substrate binding protein n=1 Tax=Defluviitalea phaphyphila TaxID=1473580 RepID=UPI0007302A81|nr:tripartite tricarboxylate transporter substrate binding protein [Defluviitalea phaphyphila]